MTLVEHLTELRRRLVISILALTAGGAVAFFFYDEVLTFLREPYCAAVPPGTRCTLRINDPVEAFTTRLRVSMWLGLFVASPVVLWQAWRFVTPGLYPREKRYAVPFVAASVVLFTGGGVVGMLTFPRALEFFVAVGGEGTEPFYSAGPYLRLVVLIVAAFGLAFEFPVVLVFLQLAGVLSSARLRRSRRGAVVGIFVIAAIVTPTQDPWSMLAMAGPMYVFYEASIIVGRILKK